MSDDFEFEPVRGLPAYLPEGEALLWQGSPHWISATRQIFHAGLVATYFGVLIAWRLFSTYWTGGDMVVALASASGIATVGLLALGLLALLGWLTARTTVYSITSRRVIMRYGIALPLTVNLPYAQIVSANLAQHRDGTGNIALTLSGDGKLGYLHLWPHARPWYLKDPQPTLRCLVNPANIANLLSKAMIDHRPDAARTPVMATTAAAPASQQQNVPYGTASA